MRAIRSGHQYAIARRAAQSRAHVSRSSGIAPQRHGADRRGRGCRSRKDGSDARHENEFTIHNRPPGRFSYPGRAPNPVAAAPNQLGRAVVIRGGPRREAAGFNSIPYNRKDYEIYRPPYVFTPGVAPTIDAVTRSGAATTRANYGDVLHIRSSQPAAGTEAALIRPGAATHHTDSEQRYVALTVSNASGNEFDVTIPNDRNLAPPGYYMLWIIKGGKPCAEARFILVGSYLAPAPPAVPASDRWCVVVTAAMDRSMRPKWRSYKGCGANWSKVARLVGASSARPTPFTTASRQVARRMRRDEICARPLAVSPSCRRSS